MALPKDYKAIAEEYIRGVADGSILVCDKVRRTIQRHLDDLVIGHTRGLWFDPEPGAELCRLAANIRPSKWDGTLDPQPWQCAMFSILYGWKRADGTRRFRIAFLMFPRKTGKSAIASVQCLYHLTADGERGAEVYALALTKDQARRVFDEAVAMRDGTPALRREIQKAGVNPCRELNVQATASVFKPLSRDKDTMEGLNVSCAIGDELHKWKSRDTWDVIRYGMRSRKQPLLEGITTAPSIEDNSSICNTLYNLAEKVLTGVLHDDAFFPWITELDGEIQDAEGNVISPADEWDDETKWIKANPNLGVTVKLEDMRQEALEAKNSPESLNAFKRYSLNLRVGAANPAISMAHWDRCARKGDPVSLRKASMERLKGRICFGALDLALTFDTSAFTLFFPPLFRGQKWEIVPFFWIPEENISIRCERDRVPYDLWRDQGFLHTTPGETTDHDWIADGILHLATLFDLREVIYDPALALGFVKKLLTEGFKEDKVIKFAQTFMNYAAPCGDFSRTIIRQELVHDGDPVLRWQISNLRWLKNHTGLIMPDKLKSIEKIDGAVASIMAFGRANHPDNAKLIKDKPMASTI